ncbi:MAG: hypothetical protein BroJett029_05160 [Alphaproteobacteria bacterium]|nr:MAG: hypothetical protein BroJett029_05160 [Alphaproteobacteria bacterium]
MRKARLEVGELVVMMDFLAVEKRLSALPGVIEVAMNAASSTATVTYDDTGTDPEVIRREIEACGFHCGGESVPCHICIPDSTGVPPPHARASAAAPSGHERHDSHGAIASEDRPAVGSTCESWSRKRATAS